MPPINESDLDWTVIDEGTMRARRKQLSEATDGEQIGCSLYELPPGERSWPYHYHTANEEALYVLSGTGSLRRDGKTHTLSAGDFCSFPAEDSGAHRVINDADEPLRYLVVSTMEEPDVLHYPDSGKVGVFVGSPPGGRGDRSLHGYYRIDDDVGYWEGEE